MATAADGRAAHAALLTFAPLSKHGYCWYYVWRAYAAAGASTSMGSTPTALAAWNVTQGRHPGDWAPPSGAAIWLGRRRSDGNQDGDVFIAGEYDGDHAATDYPGWGSVGRVSIQGRINQTGREYLGWSDHVLDCPITLGGTVPPEPEPEPEREWDMLVMQINTWDGGGIQGTCFALGPGTLYVCRDADEALSLASRNNPGGQLIAVSDADLLIEFDARGIPREAVNAPGGTNGSWAKRAALNTEPE